MKQVIVLVAMIALGLAIAGFLKGFETTAESMADAANNSITSQMLIPAS